MQLAIFLKGIHEIFKHSFNIRAFKPLSKANGLRCSQFL